MPGAPRDAFVGDDSTTANNSDGSAVGEATIGTAMVWLITPGPNVRVPDFAV